MNLNIVPTQLVERVDVVTGGASAVYGSDAVAGVVNFVLRKDFEGIMIDGQVGAYQDGNGNEFAEAVLNDFNLTSPGAKLDGRNVATSITLGANSADGRGNITAFLGYEKQNEVTQDQRDFSACGFGGDGNPVTGGVSCSGSGNFRSDFDNGLHLAEDGTFVPLTGGPSQLYNFGPLNHILRPIERFNISVLGHYEITDNTEAYLEMTFMNNHTDVQIAESALFNRSSVNCANPFLNAPVHSGGTWADTIGCDAAAIAADTDVSINYRHRNVDGDPRRTIIDNSVWRLVGGLKGQLGDHWNWDAFGQFSRVNDYRVSQNDLSTPNVQNALFVIDDPANPGTPICRDPAAQAAGCVPWNIFSRPGGNSGVTQEAVDWIQATAVVIGSTEQIVVGGTLTGDLADYGFQFPWAENGVQFLGGVEYRRDSLESIPDALSQTIGGLQGTGGATLPVSGEVSVWELFMETQIPLIQGKAFIEELSINGAYRFSDYSTEGNGVQNSFDTNTFSAGLSWVPVADVRFRGQFQRAVRAPNVIELFTGQNTGLFNLEDPCAPPATATAAQCAFTGLPAAQYNNPALISPAEQLNSVNGGNPLLNAEKADTYTFGVVFTPSYVPGFTLAVDYFDISIADAIGQIPPATTVTECLNTGDPVFCDNVVRDSRGTLWSESSLTQGVFGTNTNVADSSTRGIDVASTYNVDLAEMGLGDLGSLNFNYASTFLFELSSIPVPGVSSVIECKGLYRGPCGGPKPEYRHRFVTTWQTPWNIDLTTIWRYYSGVTESTGELATGGVAAVPDNVIDERLDSANYLDLAARWYVRENVTLRAGINNIMGRDPELSTAAGTAPGNGNTFPGTYDPLGRYMFFGVNVSL